MKELLKKPRVRKALHIALFFAFFLFILWITLLSRKPAEIRHYHMELFRPFRIWAEGLPGRWDKVLSYILNIGLFVPFGFLFPKRSVIYVFLCALITTLTIEVTQYVFALGWGDIDDVVSNTAGALIGYWAMCLWHLRRKKQ